MPLAPGSRLGHYEILEPLGTALEERYKASDTRSKRLVAITVLSPDVSTQPQLKARLERDSRTLSSLKHPNISGPIEIGEMPSSESRDSESRHFLVSEYIEGETLARRLTGGALDTPDALAIAASVAESLDTAHRQGIVHGGLNPSTIVMTAEGPKLVDFGVATLTGGTPGAESTDPRSAPSASMTTTRTSMSSLAAVPSSAMPYLAPEQLAGGAIDARTDVFSLGAVLYEMLTGRPAFQEKTQALLVAAVQSVDPEPVSSLQPAAPAVLDHLVARCLHKDPKQRVQTARDLASQIHWIAQGGSQVGLPVPVVARRTTREGWVWAAAAAGLVVAVGLTPSAWSSFRSAPEPDPVRFTVPGIPTRVEAPIAITPDGRWVLASPANANGLVGVLLDSVRPQQLIDGEFVAQPFFSPDSRSVAFFDTQAGNPVLKRAELAGGPAQVVSEAPTPIAGGTWGTHGDMLFSSQGVIQRVLAAGGDPTPVTSLDESLGEQEHLGPYFLPDGNHFLYVSIGQESAVYVASLDSPERMRLFAAESKPFYAEPGYILFNRGGTLFAQPFDADALALSGEPIRVIDGLPMLTGAASTPNMSSTANYAVSQAGVLVFKAGGNSTTGDPTAGTPQPRSLIWRDRSGSPVARVETAGWYMGIDLAPDGRRFAVHRHEAGGGDDWVFDPVEGELALGRLQRLTFDATEENSSPVWSPDGTQIAFASQRNGQAGLYVKSADGTGEERLIYQSSENKAPMSWSPDGTTLVYSRLGQGQDIWAVSVDGEGEPFPVVETPFNENLGAISPDGRWIAYQSNETGRVEIYVKQFPEGPAKRQISTEGGLYPRWRGDGAELYYVDAGGLWAASIEISEGALRPGIPRQLFALTADPSGPHPLSNGFYHRYAVSPDGERFLFSQLTGGNDVGGGVDSTVLGLVEQAVGGATGPGVGAATVIVNWPQMLEQR